MHAFCAVQTDRQTESDGESNALCPYCRTEAR